MVSKGPLTDGSYRHLLHQLAEEPPSRALLVRILAHVSDAAAAERVFCFRLRRGGGFRVLAARDRDGESLSNPAQRMSHYAVSKMLESGRPWFVPDARTDRRFRTQDALAGRKPPITILVFPLRVRGEVIGGVYLDHRFRALSPDCVDRPDVSEGIALCALALGLHEQTTRLRWLERRREDERRTRGLPRAEVSETPKGPAHSGRISAGELEEFHGLQSSNPDMLDLFDTVRGLENSDIPILIQGATGTGKGLLARAVHACSRRRDAPFVVQSCGAVPDTLMESELLGHARGAFTGAETDRTGLLVEAHGGTLFLDEVGDLSLEMQKKLLRVLEGGNVRPLGGKDTVEVDVRIVAASCHDLEDLVSQGKFRRDLFYRLKGTILEMLPLRERWEDVPGLAASFLRRHAAPEPPELLPAAVERLIRHPWPGNVRELENEMQRLAALGLRRVRVEDLSRSLRSRRSQSGRGAEDPQESLDDVVSRAERAAIVDALRRCAGNKSQAAEQLRITRKALYRRLAKYRIGSGLPRRDES